jgi:pentatricopeptide repeat protein
VDIIKKVESLMEEFHVRPSISYLVRLSQAYARTTPVDFTKLDQIQSQVTALSPEPNLSLMGSYLVAFDRSNLLENAMDIVKNIMSLNVDIPLDVACGMVRVMAACQSYENVAQFLGTLPDRLLVGFQSTPYTRMMTAGSSAQLPVIIYEFAIEGFLTARKVQSALHLISAIPKDISNILLVYKRMFLHFAEQGDLEKMEEWYRRMRFHTSYSGAGMRIASGVAATLATKLVQAGRADYLFQNLGPGRSLFTTTPTVLGAVVDALDTNSIPKYCIAKLERAVVNYNHSMQPSYVLMREYARKGRYRDVNRLFYRLLKRIKEPSDLMYSFVIEASLLANQPDRALEAFEQMKEAGMHPNLTACRLLSKHYAFNGPDIVRLTELWDSAAKSIDGVDNDPGLAGFTLIGLVHAENFNGSIDLYTSKRLTVLWPEEALNALVLCYLRADQDEKAAKLFEELHGSQPRVHPISYIGMLHSCVAKWQREEFSKLAKDFSSSIQGQLPASHFTPSKFVAGLVALIKDKQFIDSSSTVYISLSKWETENASKQLTHDELRSFSALMSAIS